MHKIVLAITAVAFVAILALLAASLLGGDPATHGARIERHVIDSALTGGERPVTIVVPEGAEEDDPRPLVVFLHGKGGDSDDQLHDELFAALEDLGDRAPVVVTPDGGDGQYWHDRAAGDWGRYVTEEVIPAAIDQAPADPERVAVGGISMGGFGALDLARLHPGRFCAVGAHSPALWRTGGETAPGAFDHAEDFAAHDVVGAASTDPDAFASQPVWVDAGDEDPFVPGIDAFVAGLQANGADVRAHRWDGGHEGAYWREHFDEYLRFYARACAQPRSGG